MLHTSPSKSLLQGRKLALDGLATIAGRNRTYSAARPHVAILEAPHRSTNDVDQ
jgi:hypothetical protein